MKTFDATFLKTTVATAMKLRSQAGIWDGRSHTPYFEKCRAQYVGPDITTGMVFTRENGYHSGGWWKNPDYEYCYHLSLSFHDTASGEPMLKYEPLTQEWLKLFFSTNIRLLWSESPYSEMGKKMDIWHYRLFCNEHWQPILPKGEVYTTQFTERGWKSYSELTVLSKL